MKRILFSLFVFLAATRWLGAHPASVNLFVNPNTNQLFALNTFAPGQFVRFGDIEVSAAAPGFGVTFPANNVALGASLDLEIVQDLLYWDGFGLGSTGVSIEFDAPEFDNEGNLNNSPVNAYSVSQSSGKLTGMHWGNYTGNNFWEAHSLYFMDSLEAPHGIYGMVVRVSSDLHVASDPTLIPFIYDPTTLDDPDGQWSSGQEANAITMLQEATDAHQIADLNVDGHVDTEDIDALVAVSAAGTHLPAFDLTGDGDVDQNDILEWLSQAGTAKTPLQRSPFCRATLTWMARSMVRTSSAGTTPSLHRMPPGHLAISTVMDSSTARILLSGITTNFPRWTQGLLSYPSQ